MVRYATSNELLQPLSLQQVWYRISFYADDAVIFLRPFSLDEEVTLTANILSCSINAFPYTYLGFPLTIGKPTKVVLLPLLDKVANYLPRWKASLMNRARWLVMVRVVLTAALIYLLIAMDMPK